MMAPRRFDKPYSDYSRDELDAELVTLESEIRAREVTLKADRQALRDMKIDIGLVIREIGRRRSEEQPVPTAEAQPEPSTQKRRCFHCGAGESRRIPMESVDGLDGEVECKNQAECERRITRNAA